LETNLVRLRSMSGYLGDRYVMVNIPGAQIEAVENNRVAQRHTAIVGRTSRQTPILNSKIYELNLNPYWTAPVSIVRKDIIPVMRKNPTYLSDNKIRVFKADGTELTADEIDWSSDEATKYRFRQEPGRINAMGSVKINFPNPHAVYMHDTPQQSLFSRLLRFKSSGCVRVQNVRDLLTWLAKDTPGWSRRNIEQTIATGERIDIKLAEPVPVYFTYITAWSTADGIVHFRDDIYRRDGVDELALGQ
jgi:murein L,D-transpeptidase YcbB/YkuD